MSNRQDAKVAKTNKFDVTACGETTFGKLGVLGVLAVKNAADVVLQEKTMMRTAGPPFMGWLRKNSLVLFQLYGDEPEFTIENHTD